MLPLWALKYFYSLESNKAFVEIIPSNELRFYEVPSNEGASSSVDFLAIICERMLCDEKHCCKYEDHDRIDSVRKNLRD